MFHKQGCHIQWDWNDHVKVKSSRDQGNDKEEVHVKVKSSRIGSNCLEGLDNETLHNKNQPSTWRRPRRDDFDYLL